MTKDQANELFRYEEGKLFWKKLPTSGRRSITGEAGGLNGNGYRSVCVGRKRYFSHHLIFLMHHGYIPDEVDHIDGDPSNNSIENLREATHYQNMLNRKIGTNNTSGFKGVSWNTRKNAWFGYVTSNGKRKCVGYFKDLTAAVDAVKVCRDMMHGNFAKAA